MSPSFDELHCREVSANDAVRNTVICDALFRGNRVPARYRRSLTGAQALLAATGWPTVTRLI